MMGQDENPEVKKSDRTYTTGVKPDHIAGHIMTYWNVFCPCRTGPSAHQLDRPYTIESSILWKWDLSNYYMKIRKDIGS